MWATHASAAAVAGGSSSKEDEEGELAFGNGSPRTVKSKGFPEVGSRG